MATCPSCGIITGRARWKWWIRGRPPLGALPEAASCESRLRLGHGDSLILPTDGVLGCTHGAGESFHFPRLPKVVEEAGRTDTLLIPPIVHAVPAFTKDGQRPDDLTPVQVTRR